MPCTAEEEPREFRGSTSLQMKLLQGLQKESQGNIADGKRKKQGYQLTTKDWANFHCRFFSLFHTFFSLFSSDVLVAHLSLS